jgi:hypothetical protein
MAGLGGKKDRRVVPLNIQGGVGVILYNMEQKKIGPRLFLLPGHTGELHILYYIVVHCTPLRPERGYMGERKQELQIRVGSKEK